APASPAQSQEQPTVSEAGNGLDNFERTVRQSTERGNPEHANADQPTQFSPGISEATPLRPLPESDLSSVSLGTSQTLSWVSMQIPMHPRSRSLLPSSA